MAISRISVREIVWPIYNSEKILFPLFSPNWVKKETRSQKIRNDRKKEEKK